MKNKVPCGELASFVVSLYPRQFVTSLGGSLGLYGSRAVRLFVQWEVQGWSQAREDQRD